MSSIDFRSSTRLRQLMYLTALFVIVLTTAFPLTIVFTERARFTSSAQATYILLQPTANRTFGRSLGNYSSDQLLISNAEIVDFMKTLNVSTRVPSLFQHLNITGPLTGHSAVFMMNLSNYQGLEIDSLELKVFIASVMRPGLVHLIWLLAPSDFSSLQSKSYPSGAIRFGLADAISVIRPGIHAWKVKLGFAPERNQQMIMELSPGSVQTENLFKQGIYEPDAVSVVALSAKSNRPPDIEITFVRKYDPPGAQAFGIWIAYGIVTIYALKHRRWVELLYNLVFIASALWLIAPILIFRFGLPTGGGLSLLLAAFFLLFLLRHIRHNAR